MTQTTRGHNADLLGDEGAVEALVTAFEQYVPPTTERGRRRERLRKLVESLTEKGCSINEIVRVLSKSGVRTSWRSVKKLRAAAKPTAQTASQPSPHVRPPGKPEPDERQPQTGFKRTTI